MKSGSSSISRRGFLGRTATLAAAPLILPSSARGASSPSNRVAVGMIGTGGRGRSHIVGLHKLKERAQVIAVCDVNAANREEAAGMRAKMEPGSPCHVYEDYRELLARDDIDAVVIAVPDHWHAGTILAACRAGKHVYGEKPLAYSVAEGRAIVDTVARHGVVFQHGTQQRSWDIFRHACLLARTGRLGRVHTIRVGSPFGKKGGSTEPAPPPEGLNYDFWLGSAPYTPYTPGRCDGRGGEGWYQIRDYSGGWITAWGSHDVDIAQWGNATDHTGPVEVEGWGEVPLEGAYDAVWKWRLECRYANGTTVIYASEHENPHGIRFEGGDGWVFVNRGGIQAEPASLLAERFKPDEIDVVEANGHLGNFLDAIQNGAAVTAPAETAHRSTTACHLCNIAVALGRKLQWDPERERFVNDAEADRLLSRAMRAPWSI